MSVRTGSVGVGGAVVALPVSPQCPNINSSALSLLLLSLDKVLPLSPPSRSPPLVVRKSRFNKTAKSNALEYDPEAPAI